MELPSMTLKRANQAVQAISKILSDPYAVQHALMWTHAVMCQTQRSRNSQMAGQTTAPSLQTEVLAQKVIHKAI
jgi:predicted metal-dependent HD superfamily phosphohydrolase